MNTPTLLEMLVNAKVSDISYEQSSMHHPLIIWFWDYLLCIIRFGFESFWGGFWVGIACFGFLTDIFVPTERTLTQNPISNRVQIKVLISV